jgi:hypothetical protein
MVLSAAMSAGAHRDYLARSLTSARRSAPAAAASCCRSGRRGDRRGARPKRSASRRIDICIISTAQQAVPNSICISDPARAQGVTSSAAAVTKAASGGELEVGFARKPRGALGRLQPRGKIRTPVLGRGSSPRGRPRSARVRAPLALEPGSLPGRNALRTAIPSCGSGRPSRRSGDRGRPRCEAR